VTRYAQQYTKAFRDVAVQVVWVPGDYATRLNTALLTAGGPDVFEKQYPLGGLLRGGLPDLEDELVQRHRMIIFLAALQEIPRSIYEAAEVDGARPGWQTLRLITMP
jgi:hypothetical protein